MQSFRPSSPVDLNFKVSAFHRPTSPPVTRLAIHFARLGPYHLARIDSAAALLRPAGWEVIGLETGSSDTTYGWREEESGRRDWQRHTVFPCEAAERIYPARMSNGISAALSWLKPEAVVIAGWGTADARACLAWCRKNRAKAVVMSETREADGQRVWWKEFLKSRIIRRFDAALVGGKSHRDYLLKLGMPANHVHFGYNVVDNAYFAEACLNIRKAEGDCRWRRPYFLASNRFIKRKNLARLVEAYFVYNQESKVKHDESTLWNLCLLGEGELKAELIAQCHSLGLTVATCAPWEDGGSTECGGLKSAAVVYFPGFRQIEELPQFYAHAGCFIHPALEEPWGLVINEAMACGLPILSSRNVGAAEELVVDGGNGWRFDPTDVEEIRNCLLRVSAPEFSSDSFAAASRRLLEERAPLAAFGEGLRKALGGVSTTTDVA